MRPQSRRDGQLRSTPSSPRITQKSRPELDLAIVERPISALRPFPHNARTHSKRQIHQIAASIQEFGFNSPILVDESNTIIAGHGRVEAAKLLGLSVVPTIRVDHLTDAQKRAYVLADNRLALNAGWDPEILAIELLFGGIQIGDSCSGSSNFIRSTGSHYFRNRWLSRLAIPPALSVASSFVSASSSSRYVCAAAVCRIVTWRAIISVAASTLG